MNHMMAIVFWWLDRQIKRRKAMSQAMGEIGTESVTRNPSDDRDVIGKYAPDCDYLMLGVEFYRSVKRICHRA